MPIMNFGFTGYIDNFDVTTLEDYEGKKVDVREFTIEQIIMLVHKEKLVIPIMDLLLKAKDYHLELDLYDFDDLNDVDLDMPPLPELIKAEDKEILTIQELADMNDVVLKRLEEEETNLYLGVDRLGEINRRALLELEEEYEIEKQEEEIIDKSIENPFDDSLDHEEKD